MPHRRLIVNADDFGLSSGVNEGIVRGHREGIVTSTSLMVRTPAAGEAAELSRRHPALAVGLHVDIGEWVCRDGVWVSVYERVSASDPGAVASEVNHQLALFRELIGRGPTHLDSHQHAHRKGSLRDILTDLAGRLGVPLRHFTPTVRYEGAFYGQTADGEPWPDGVRVETLLEVIRTLPEGVSELACHPAAWAGLPTAYDRERVQELAVLCDPAVRAAVDAAGVELISFAALGR